MKIRKIKTKIRRFVRSEKETLMKKGTRSRKLLLWIIKKLRTIKYTLLRYPQMKKQNQRDPNAEIPRVLISGRNYCSNLCMARAFGMAGYEVEVLRLFQIKMPLKNPFRSLKPDAYSKYVKAYHVCVSRKQDSRIINKLISLADQNHKMLLIPTDDVMANVVDSHLDRLSQYYIIPNVKNQQGELQRLMSKEAQKEVASQVGLPLLNSCIIHADHGEYQIPSSVRYPCFVKPNVSKNGLKSRMQRCDTVEELSELLTKLSARKEIEMLVEDFVEIKNEYSLLGVTTKTGTIAPGFFVADSGGHNGRRGIALSGHVLPIEEHKELIDAMIHFVDILDYEGLFDIDMIEASDGKIYFIELNLRFGGSGYAITKSGVNLPGMLADYFLKQKPVDLSTKIEVTGKHFLSEKIMIEEYADGLLDRSQINELMANADITFIREDDDPKPYKHFQKYWFFAWLKRIIK